VTFPIIGIEFHALKQNRTSMFGTTLETDLGQILVTFLRDRLYLEPVPFGRSFTRKTD
jgi:hypothetical protein